MDGIPGFCSTCKMQSTFQLRPPKHVLHALLSLVTTGAWLPIWLVAWSASKTAWHCTQCGRCNTPLYQRIPAVLWAYGGLAAFSVIMLVCMHTLKWQEHVEAGKLKNLAKDFAPFIEENSNFELRDGQKPLVGKMIIINRRFGGPPTFDRSYSELPVDLQAQSPADVSTIVWLDNAERQGGELISRGKTIYYPVYISVIDKNSHILIEKMRDSLPDSAFDIGVAKRIVELRDKLASKK